MKINFICYHYRSDISKELMENLYFVKGDTDYEKLDSFINFLNVNKSKNSQVVSYLFGDRCLINFVGHCIAENKLNKDNFEVTFYQNIDNEIVVSKSIYSEKGFLTDGYPVGYFDFLPETFFNKLK